MTGTWNKGWVAGFLRRGGGTYAKPQAVANDTCADLSISTISWSVSNGEWVEFNGFFVDGEKILFKHWLHNNVKPLDVLISVDGL